MGSRISATPKREPPPPYSNSPPAYVDPPPSCNPAPPHKTKYQHAVYILHPVTTRFPKFSRPAFCCVHENRVTDCWFMSTNWQEKEPPKLKYCLNTVKLICEDVPYRTVQDTVGEATVDVEAARAAGKELSLSQAVLNRYLGSQGTRPGERWDLYKAWVLSDWPETLYNPDQDAAQEEW